MNKFKLELDYHKIPTLVYAGEISSVYKFMDAPQKVAETMEEVIGKSAEEYVYMIALNTKRKPIGAFEVSHGTVDMSIVTPREIYIRALVSGASSIILVHNHPSGYLTPSKKDIELTEAVASVGKLMNIPLVDHIIIADGEYFSFKENKYLI